MYEPFHGAEVDWVRTAVLKGLVFPVVLRILPPVTAVVAPIPLRSPEKVIAVVLASANPVAPSMLNTLPVVPTIEILSSEEESS